MSASLFDKLKPLVAAFAILATGFAAPASALTYNVINDWSDSSNSGTWTYREGNNALPSVPDWFFAAPGVPAQPAWGFGDPNHNFLPAWFKATEAATLATLDYQIGDVVVHTTDSTNGPASGIANLLFISPVSGVADISGAIWNARDALRAQKWELRVDGNLVDSGVLPGNGTVTRAAPDAINLSNINLDANDLIVLSIFMDASNTTGFGDFVGLSLNIDITPGETPLPAALPLFAGGLGALGLLGWRRKRKQAA